MLSQSIASLMGAKATFSYPLDFPDFVDCSPMWVKEQSSLILKTDLPHLYSFHKLGKTLGLETVRYLQYGKGMLLYYDEPKSKKAKGYCRLQNLYLIYISKKKQHVLYLTNGSECSQFHFQNDSFYDKHACKLHKFVIQFNFAQNYRIDKIIGSGNFSQVYQGINKNDGHVVAVKWVSKKDKNGVSTQNIVTEEKKIMAMLSSPYVCQMLEFYQQNQAYIFVMENVPGKNLMTVLKQNDLLPFKVMVDILENTLQGLKYCHSREIIHRDIKPQNIIVNLEDNSSKLIDFGLSLNMKEAHDCKQFRRCGTLGYMAPEVISNTNQIRTPYDYKCDMFSFGIVAHMVLFLHNPLKGNNKDETRDNNSLCHIVLDEQRISEEYGAACYQWLQALLAKNPEDRLSAQQALNSAFLQQARQSLLKAEKSNKQPEHA